MIEYFIFIMIFLAISVSAVISSIGWLNADHLYEDMIDENNELREKIDNLTKEVSKLNTLNNFYKNRLCEKVNDKGMINDDQRN